MPLNTYVTMSAYDLRTGDFFLIFFFSFTSCENSNVLFFDLIDIMPFSTNSPVKNFVDIFDSGIKKKKKTCEIEFSIYDEELEFCESGVAKKGNLLALFKGGHGLKVLNDTKFLEVKQGPYDEEIDKTRF